MKKHGIDSALILMIAATTYLGCQHKPILPELQRKCLLARTEEANAEVVAELEDYYFNLPVPRALRDSVEHEVAAQIDTTKINWTDDNADSNVYRTEVRLQDLLTFVAIAGVRGETVTFRNLIRSAKVMAKAVHAATENDYWVSFVERLAHCTREDLRVWLMAKKAETLCRALQNDGRLFPEAEAYAAMGLKLLQSFEDTRLRLDIYQRLLWILYQHHSHYDLVRVFAVQSFMEARIIAYHFRATGFLYAHAEALRRAGENQAALEGYDRALAHAKAHKAIPNMAWYIRNTILRMGDIHLESGEFDEALRACDVARDYELGPGEVVVQELLKFNVYLANGHYEQADTALENATAAAVENRNLPDLIQCINNRGVWHSRLADDDSALVYYRRADSLFTDTSLDLEMRIKVLANIAGILSAKNDSAQFRRTVEEAQQLLDLTNSASMKTFLLHNVGIWYQIDHQYERALRYFTIADSIASQNELRPFVVTLRMDMVDCLIALARFAEAQSLLERVAVLAKELNALEGRINVLDRMARIQYHIGRFDEALENSRLLLAAIEEMSLRFQNSERLIAYRQKVYDLLKNATLCHMAAGQQEAAFAKLIAAKAYALKSRLLRDQAISLRQAEEERGSDAIRRLRAQLQPKQLLLDYMITSDSLYVFALDQIELRLLHKQIDLDQLRQTARAYRDSIHKTLTLFQNYEPTRTNAHFFDTTRLGRELYQTLLDWPELGSVFQQAELLYIVPDEFLFETPFSTLVAAGTNPQTFLASQAAVVTLPSADLLLVPNASNGVHHRPEELQVLISADRRFPATDQFLTKIAALFPSAVELTLPDSCFTKAAVLAQLEKKRNVYIFLGHGKANVANPTLGYMELSVKVPRVGVKRIRLTMRDLQSLNWRGTELVMLIGCETADGKLYRGTGISGLQQEFLALGVKNVLGNLWEVESTHAIDQAQDFLRLWATTWNPPQALQNSQRIAMKALAENPYYERSHPYFWGSAVLQTSVSHQAY